MFLRLFALAPLLASIGAASLAVSAAATPPERTRVFATALDQPVAMASTPAEPQRLFVCGLPGEIYSLNISAEPAVSPTLFLDLRPVVAVVGDGGLLGMAFHPSYATNGYFYVFYNAAPSTPNDRVLARYHATPGATSADPGSGTILWQYPRSIGHNGGWIGFSPTNGYLYLSSGDGGTGFSFDAPNRAQTLTNQLMGKILRIDVSGDDFPTDPLRNYRIPASNPFRMLGGADEIWAYGVRNPWRCSFDRLAGDLYIADVGQDQREEIDLEPPTSIGGRNYGWKCIEGTLCTGLDGGPGCVCGSGALTPPVFEYDHTIGHSITGGYVYRGPAMPSLQGTYFYADFQDNRLFSLRVVGGVAQDFAERTAELRPPYPATAPMSNISAFGEDAAGELYISDFFGGNIYKIVPNTCPADFNGLDGLSVQDIFDFINAWFAVDTRADFNGQGGLTTQDIFDFLNAWLAGC